MTGRNFYIGSYYNAVGVWTFRAVSVEGAPHWPMPSYIQEMHPELMPLYEVRFEKDLVDPRLSSVLRMTDGYCVESR